MRYTVGGYNVQFRIARIVVALAIASAILLLPLGLIGCRVHGALPTANCVFTSVPTSVASFDAVNSLE